MATYTVTSVSRVTVKLTRTVTVPDDQIHDEDDVTLLATETIEPNIEVISEIDDEEIQSVKRVSIQ